MNSLTIDVSLKFQPDLGKMSSLPFPTPMSNSTAALQIIQQAVVQLMAESGFEPEGFTVTITAHRGYY